VKLAPIALLITCVSCAGESPGPGPWFVHATDAVGLGTFSQENGNREKPYIIESVGGGLAFLDYDRDGWLDLYCSNGSSVEGFPAGEEPNDALFRNEEGVFRDVTSELGVRDTSWTNGARAVDYDGDGWTDVYLTNWGPNRMLRNDGGERFVDVTPQVGADDASYSTGACFLDHDRDGDLDLYVVNYVEFDPATVPRGQEQYKGLSVYFGPRGLPGAADVFYRNEDGRYVDRTEEVGVGGAEGFGFQAVAFDADEDGWVDIYVGNDSTPNRLWRNDGDGTFSDLANRSGLGFGKSGKAQAAMGVAVGDADGDGRFDLFITNFSEDYYTLYRNEGGGSFSDVSLKSGLVMPTWDYLGWGCGFADFDNDGTAELYAVNGHVYPQVDEFETTTRYRQRNQLFAREASGGYREITAEAGPGFALEEASRGAVVGDYDNDGDLDLVVGNIDGPPAVLRNDTRDVGHWIKVELLGTPGGAEPVGARVEVVAGGRLHAQPVLSGSGFLSTHDPRLHFGLGPVQSVEELTVTWPDGAREAFGDLAVDRLYRLQRGTGDLVQGSLR